MSEKLPISVLIVARNAEKLLPRCLDSVKDWASEIIAVINDCTDNTRGLLEQYGAKVYENPWENIVKQKNVALGHSTQPWIFIIDADEEVTPKLARAIQDFFKNDTGRFGGAYFARKNWFMGRWILHGDWYPNHQYRLFHRDKGKIQSNRPEHDSIKIQGGAKKLDGHLLHYSYEDINQMVTKLIFFGDAFRETQLKKGKKWSLPEALIRTGWRFFRSYILRLGFLDGYPGFFIAYYQAYYTTFRYSKLYENKIKDIKPEIETSDK